MSMTYKFGKLPPLPDKRNIKLRKILRKELLPPLPDTYDIDDALGGIDDNRMFANDEYGNCVIAARAHQTFRFEKYEQGKQIAITDQEVIDQYLKESFGMDMGLILLVSLKRWRKEGWPVGEKTYTIYAFAEVDWKNHEEVKHCIHLLGGVNFGMLVYQCDVDQFEAGEAWHLTESPGPYLGGHGVYAYRYGKLIGYDERGLTCMTWGKRQRMTWAFWDARCIAPETKVLTADLRWVTADEIKVGDTLLGFNENRSIYQDEYGQLCRRWRKATVEKLAVIERPCYELEFEDGTIVRCSAEHKWLCDHGHSGADWVTTQNLRCGPLNKSKVIKPLDVWDITNTHDAGYLAGAYDGEGTLVQRDLTDTSHNKRGIGVADVRLAFAQSPTSLMLPYVAKLLNSYGFSFSSSNGRGGIKNSEIAHITIGKRRDVLRFLGSVRPVRLLHKFNIELLGKTAMDRSVRVIRKDDIGLRSVIAMETDTRTFLAEGLASHNCDEAYGIVDNRDDWLEDSPLDVEKLDQYLFEITGEGEPSLCPVMRAEAWLGNLPPRIFRRKSRFFALAPKSRT